MLSILSLGGTCLLDHSPIGSIFLLSGQRTVTGFVKFVFLLIERQGKERDIAISVFSTNENRKPSLSPCCQGPWCCILRPVHQRLCSLWIRSWWECSSAGLAVGPQGVETHGLHLLFCHESRGCNKLTTSRKPVCHLSHSHSYCWAFVRESFVTFENVISRK